MSVLAHDKVVCGDSNLFWKSTNGRVKLVSFPSSGSFGCTFDMFYYPFDTQRCFALLQSSVSQDLVEFSRDQHVLTFLDDQNLPSYFVNNFRIHVTVLDTNQTIYSLLQVTRKGGEQDWVVEGSS